MRDKVNAPVTFPAAVATAVARPHAIARAIMKRTLGPGARMIDHCSNEVLRVASGEI